MRSRKLKWESKHDKITKTCKGTEENRLSNSILGIFHQNFYKLHCYNNDDIKTISISKLQEFV